MQGRGLLKKAMLLTGGQGSKRAIGQQGENLGGEGKEK